MSGSCMLVIVGVTTLDVNFLMSLALCLEHRKSSTEKLHGKALCKCTCDINTVSSTWYPPHVTDITS